MSFTIHLNEEMDHLFAPSERKCRTNAFDLRSRARANYVFKTFNSPLELLGGGAFLESAALRPIIPFHQVSWTFI